MMNLQFQLENFLNAQRADLYGAGISSTQNRWFISNRQDPVTASLQLKYKY